MLSGFANPMDKLYSQPFLLTGNHVIFICRDSPLNGEYFGAYCSLTQYTGKKL